MTTATATRAADVAIEGLDVCAYTIPTDGPESDGTLAWDSTTIAVVEAHAGGETGIGYSYGHRAIASRVALRCRWPDAKPSSAIPAPPM